MIIEAASNAPAWYQVVAGILAIPTAVIGFAYSYVLIKKARLEARKTELEIEEKLRVLSETTPADAVPPTPLLEPAIRGFVVSSLILRYILFELIVRISGVFTTPLQIVLGGIVFGITQAVRYISHDSGMMVALTVTTQILHLFNEAIYWLLFFVLAWPLFKDILKALGVTTKDIGLRAIIDYVKNWRNVRERLLESSRS